MKKLPFEKEIVEGATLELECRVGEMETSEVITDVDLKGERSSCYSNMLTDFTTQMFIHLNILSIEYTFNHHIKISEYCVYVTF